jgi:hypothetical protein
MELYLHSPTRLYGVVLSEAQGLHPVDGTSATCKLAIYEYAENILVFISLRGAVIAQSV